MTTPRPDLLPSTTAYRTGIPANPRQCMAVGCERVHEGPATQDYTKWLLAPRGKNGAHAFYCPAHFPVMSEEELHILGRAAEILEARGMVGYHELADGIVDVLGANVAKTGPRHAPAAMVNRNRKRAGLKPLEPYTVVTAVPLRKAKRRTNS